MGEYRHILGVSAFYHDSAAALVRDGEIVAAAQEERFSRRKNDEDFPVHAITYCLSEAGITLQELDALVFYDKPIPKFARMLETYLAVAPSGLGTFRQVMPNWLGEKLNLRKTIQLDLPELPDSCQVLFTEHHQSHAASAFFPSPYDEAAVLTVDGVGEYATTTLGKGSGCDLEILKEIRFPHSLGLLYSAFTAYCGFRVNSGEYKLMGLAPYGEPRYADQIRDHLLDIKPDGSFRLNMDYFHFLKGWTMTNDRFHQLFGGQPRQPETQVEQRHMDVARSVQVVTEEVLLKLARHAREATGLTNLCMAGGVALNCVANGKIVKEKIFDSVWIQPAAGDAGGALGAALAVWNMGKQSPGSKQPQTKHGVDQMKGALLGPSYRDEEIEATLEKFNANYKRLDDETLFPTVVDLLEQEKVVGWFQDRMEFGPRALGNRSIIGDARSTKMQSIMNLKVKFRESFRPFAPIVLKDRLKDYFDLEGESPYMLIVGSVLESRRKEYDQSLRGLDLLKAERSDLPAITHVDYSARIQTVDEERNPRLHQLLRAFELQTGCAVLVNTSFNVRGEPVVCSPEDAYRCFVNTEMDVLVLGNYVLMRTEQPVEPVETMFHPIPD